MMIPKQTKPNDESHAPFKKWRKDWIKAGQPDWRAFFIPRLRRWLEKNLLSRPCKIEAFGPCGICNRVLFDVKSGNGRMFSIALEPSLHHGDLWMCRRLDLPATSEFKPATIGALNGMQYPKEYPGGDPPASWFRSRLGKP